LQLKLAESSQRKVGRHHRAEETSVGKRIIRTILCRGKKKDYPTKKEKQNLTLEQGDANKSIALSKSLD